MLAFGWIACTCVMLLYGMTAAIIYMVDLQIPLVREEDQRTYHHQLHTSSLWQDYQSSCDNHPEYDSDLQSKTVQAVMVLPMFFARGFLVWLVLLGFLIFFVYAVVIRKPKNKVGNSCDFCGLW